MLVSQNIYNVIVYKCPFLVIFSIGNLGNNIFETSFLYTWLTAGSAVPKREMTDFFFTLMKLLKQLAQDEIQQMSNNSKNKFLLNIKKQYWIINMCNLQIYGKQYSFYKVFLFNTCSLFAPFLIQIPCCTFYKWPLLLILLTHHVKCTL